MENGTKQQAYQRPEAEAIKLRNGSNLLINFSANGSLGEWEEDE